MLNEINIVFDGNKILAWGVNDKVAETMLQAGLDVVKVWEDIVADVLPLHRTQKGDIK